MMSKASIRKNREPAPSTWSGAISAVWTRLLDTTGIDFTDAYFRSADLRGLDLRNTPMEGASIAHAQISGVFFPPELSADEILMSVNFGTRLRYRIR